MTLYWHGEELNFDELRLDIYQRSRELQCDIVQQVLKDIFPIFRAQGFHFPEMLECFVLAAQQHYSDTTGWEIFNSAMKQVGDRPKPKESTAKFFDDFLRACKAERYHLIEVLEGFDLALKTKLPPYGNSQKNSLHLLNEACCELIQLRELETDVEYNQKTAMKTLHTAQESFQPKLRSA